MKKTILSIAAILSIGSTMACTVMPINEKIAFNDLAAKGLSKMGVSILDVQELEVKNLKANYIWTPMCPKGETSSALIYFVTDDPINGSPSACKGVVAVSKKHLYAEKAQYQVKVVRPLVCQF